MSIFDNLNPFKKKEELSFPSLDSGPQESPQFQPHTFEENNNTGLGQHEFGMHEPGTDHDFNAPSFRAPAPEMPMQQQRDNRMTMPLGETVRQQRSAEAENNEQGDTYGQPIRHNPMQKDLDLISSKLDYLKASLDAINQRLVNIEHLAKQESENKKW
jgi:hypothetical protein